MLDIRCVDTMKWDKDTVTNQPSDATINAVLDAFKLLNLTHVAISVPMNSTAEMTAHGSTPYPRTIEDFTKVWVDAIHAHGWKVLFRGTLCEIEGIYNWPISTLDTTALITKVNAYPLKGMMDLFAPVPEATGRVFSQPPFLPAPIQDNYTKLFLGINTPYTSNNYTELASGWMPLPIVANAKIVAVDHYGTSHLVSDLMSDIRALKTKYGYPVFWQEFADLWQAYDGAYLDSFFSGCKTLVDEGTLNGFSWWGGWAGNNESVIQKNTDGTYALNQKGLKLKAFYDLFLPVTVPEPEKVVQVYGASTIIVLTDKGNLWKRYNGKWTKIGLPDWG